MPIPASIDELPIPNVEPIVPKMPEYSPGHAQVTGVVPGFVSDANVFEKAAAIHEDTETAHYAFLAARKAAIDAVRAQTQALHAAHDAEIANRKAQAFADLNYDWKLAKEFLDHEQRRVSAIHSIVEKAAKTLKDPGFEKAEDSLVRLEHGVSKKLSRDLLNRMTLSEHSINSLKL